MADQALHPASAEPVDQRGYVEVDDRHEVEADEDQHPRSHAGVNHHNAPALEAADEGAGREGMGHHMGLLVSAGVDYCGDGNYRDDRTDRQLVGEHTERLACRRVQRLPVHHFA